MFKVQRGALVLLSLGITAVLSACGGETVVEPERYVVIDGFAEQMKRNVERPADLHEVSDVDRDAAIIRKR
ncbi:MAG: hypothetical protein ACI8RN_000968 [Glaciecola sp.]|jgi:hypothetical protein|uniref:hypothetical protein n=1 Tax=Congregibacter sp. TaxID=2744308 RepID=UPI0039E70AE8